MIKFISGDIFKSECEVITVTVNCKGIMGAGIAKTCKQLYPATFRQYNAKCKLGIYRPGEPRLVSIDRPLLLFPTKDDWRNNSQYSWIEDGLKRIAKNSDRFESIAIPPLGCGHGKLQWDKVKTLIEKHLGILPNVIEVYEPKDQHTHDYAVEYLQYDDNGIHSKVYEL